MAYPATTHYLTMKLNWMGRKLKTMNTPTTIIEWTKAMQSVFRTLEDISRNKDLSTPTKIPRTRREYWRAPSINLEPLNTESTVAETTMLKTVQNLEEGFLSESAGGLAKKPRLADKVELS